MFRLVGCQLRMNKPGGPRTGFEKPEATAVPKLTTRESHDVNDDPLSKLSLSEKQGKFFLGFNLKYNYSN